VRTGAALVVMRFYPAIDLREGRVVRLLRGDYDAETAYGDDPVAQARAFADAGAEFIHVVDLDAARTGDPVNLRILEAICAAVPACRVQTGGGVRSVESAADLLAAGAERVVVGSAAVTDPDLLEQLCTLHPRAVAVGLDCRGRDVAIHGWTEGSGADVADLAERFDELPLGAIVATQIDADGMLTGPDLGLYEDLLARVRTPVVASGGIASVDDLTALAAMQVDGRRLGGAIVGRALYEGAFTVQEGIAACSQPV
jgi:phosphoribosylformimino-5-aminoimidazole carboxamide ribotide isomerase